eukprot:COSAG06_NODE_4190_length_4491_cov_1.526412_4_plen_234_part_00
MNSKGPLCFAVLYSVLICCVFPLNPFCAGIDLVGLDLAEARGLGKVLEIQLVEADVCKCASTLQDAAGVGLAFDLVVDKSTTDALLCDVHGGMESVRKAAGQVARMVVPGGSFCLVSHNSLPARTVEGALPLQPAWLQAVTRGLEEGGAGDDEVAAAAAAAAVGSCVTEWALEVHRSQDVDGGPTVYLFRRRRRSKRGDISLPPPKLMKLMKQQQQQQQQQQQMFAFTEHTYE